ncbi:MAG: formimidoylglutamate deiminase [Gemmatimonadetes bacterium]|nr:formimidoylglutamate deiminase [Gemmatimonadota bacterium]
MRPDLVWDGAAAHDGWAVGVVDGRVAAVGPESDVARILGPGVATRRLDGRALLAAPVNAHSHAFQRAIRGRTQWRPAGDDVSDFWTWREEMYEVAASLEPEDLFRISRACFAEMRAAGWGSVGEFHYLHRTPDGRRYDDPVLLSHVVIEAAREVGLPICLLYAVYATGGVAGDPVEPRQQRFRTDSVDEALSNIEILRSRWAHDPGVDIGLAPHSIRAVPAAWWGELADAAETLDLPLHAHVSEQRAEVEACLALRGKRPVEWLADLGVLSERFTAIHATHVTAGEVGLLAEAGARVCACPSTERDLGDGVFPGDRFHDAGVPICLGSDSQTLLDPWEELRLPEYHLRLVHERRVVMGETDGDRVRWAPQALRSATAVGGDALRTGGGRLEPGAPAWLVSVDLEHPVFEGGRPSEFAELLAVAGRAGLAEPLS